MKRKLKNLLAVAVLIAIFVASNIYAQSDNTTKPVVVKTTYPTVDIGIMGGLYFPIADMSNNYKQGGIVGVDVGLRLNKEVGIYLNAKYYNLPNQNTELKADKLIEVTAGPRYYFTNPKLKSIFFMEAGVGLYFKMVSQKTDVNGTEIVPASTNTNIGVNAGPGFSLWLSPSINIILKAKYHAVFTSGYTSNFVTATAGLDFKL